MKRVTTLDGFRVETYDLSEEQHNLAVDMVKRGINANGNYTLEDVDADTLDIWIDDAEDEDYKNFLANAQWNDAEIYTLDDWLGDFYQTIGEVVVYEL